MKGLCKVEVVTFLVCSMFSRRNFTAKAAVEEIPRFIYFAG